MHSTKSYFEYEDREVAVSRITMTEGPDEGVEHVVRERRVVLGSGPAADIVLTDPTVSRLHCEIRRTDEVVRLRDLGSKNGCWLDTCRVHDIELSAGVRIRMGSTVFQTGIESVRIAVPAWSGGDQFGELIGGSSPMHLLFAYVSRLAGTDVPVLIRGESGTGKELVAHALHAHGSRDGGPFEVVDCAALSETLADSELFGHVRGAFTGADRNRTGALERADGGTVFLDEVGELPLDIQPKLLRALDTGSVQRVGGNERQQLDVRVLAATHRPLEEMANRGLFREDLFHRLAAAQVFVPPLRERGRDLTLLARHFAQEMGGGPEKLSSVEQAVLSRGDYAWPGNVRELRTVVRRVLALGELGTLLGDEAAHRGPVPLCTDRPIVHAKQVWLDTMTRRYLDGLLRESDGNISDVARRAGVSRSHLYRLIRKLGVVMPSKK